VGARTHVPLRRGGETQDDERAPPVGEEREDHERGDTRRVGRRERAARSGAKPPPSGRGATPDARAASETPTATRMAAAAGANVFNTLRTSPSSQE
jgi:hypothetical protein